MNNPLSNLTLLITRPNPAGEFLCHLLTQLGAKTIHYPTISIVPLHTSAPFQLALKNLGLQDWLIFISPQAVYASVPIIRQQWPQFSPQTKLAAIGEGTAQALHDAGYQVALIPEHWNSEGLLATPALQAVTNQKITIIRGQGGRKLLQEILIKRGAILTELIAYRRKLANRINISIDYHAIDAILCGSYESAANLIQLVSASELAIILSKPLLVPSERIKILAENLGFQTIWVADNASHQAYIKLLEEKRKPSWPNKSNKQ